MNQPAACPFQRLSMGERMSHVTHASYPP
jgi:hypothetical protein